ncbi:MAG: deoxyribose-phosphate aldolase [Ilumatobacter sp.]|nr:deoxyribose-phosphate aldolase [Ilumatobacter sp.]
MTTTDDPAPTADDAERARHAIGLIDLTDLADDHSASGIDELCRRAVAHGTAAVCVWPEHVARCAELLADTDQGIATVVNFPAGTDQVGPVLETTLTALSDGATEIDVVLPYRAFLAGDATRAAAMLTAVGDLVAPPGILKVILETSELGGPDDVRAASELAIEHGADFIKTSTGKAAGGASLEAARVMLDVISTAGRPVGLKPSGGIRTFADAMAYLDLAADEMGPAWATRSSFRFGASGLLDALLAVVDGGDSGPSADDGY